MSWEKVFTDCDDAEAILDELEEELPKETAEIQDRISDSLNELLKAEAFLAQKLKDRYTLLLKPQTVERYQSNLKHVKGLYARLARANVRLQELPTGDCWCGPR